MTETTERMDNLEQGEIVEGRFAQARRFAMVIEPTSKTAWVVYFVPSNEAWQAQKVSVKRIDRRAPEARTARMISEADAVRVVGEHQIASARNAKAKADRAMTDAAATHDRLQALAGRVLRPQAEQGTKDRGQTYIERTQESQDYSFVRSRMVNHEAPVAVATGETVSEIYYFHSGSTSRADLPVIRVLDGDELLPAIRELAFKAGKEAAKVLAATKEEAALRAKYGL